MIPNHIPEAVVLAILDTARETEVDALINGLDPRTQAYNQAWEILRPHVASDHSRTVITKAQAIAAQNNWDWPGIVAQVLTNRPVQIDPRAVECLRQLDQRWVENDQRQAEFDCEMEARSSHG